MFDKELLERENQLKELMKERIKLECLAKLSLDEVGKLRKINRDLYALNNKKKKLLELSE